jgi:hypothetical protein
MTACLTVDTSTRDLIHRILVNLFQLGGEVINSVNTKDCMHRTKDAKCLQRTVPGHKSLPILRAS